MKSVLLATATALVLCGGVALAQGPGNQTTTSMGAPQGSPGYAAPRSAVVPGLPAQARAAQQENAARGQTTDQGVTTPVQGPKALNGKTQTNPGG